MQLSGFCLFQLIYKTASWKYEDEQLTEFKISMQKKNKIKELKTKRKKYNISTKEINQPALQGLK